MSDQQKVLLQKLVQYGGSGSMPHFEAARAALERHSNTEKSAKIPLVTAVRVANHFITIIARNDNKIRSRQAWQCLVVMCDREHNSASHELLTELQTTAILSFVPGAMATLATDQSDLEAEGCLNFMALFTRIDGTRQVLVGENPGIIATLVGLLDTEYNRASDMLKVALTNVMSNILGRNVTYSRTNTEQFVGADGFRIMHNILRHNTAWAKNISATSYMTTYQLSVLQSFLMAFKSMFSALGNVDFSDTEVPREKHLYDADSLQATTAVLHEFFDLSANPVFKDTLLGCFVNYFQFIRSRMPESHEAMLMYAGDPTTTPAVHCVPFVIKFLRISRDEQLKHMLETVGQLLGGYGFQYPAIKALIHQELHGSTVGYVPSYGFNAVVCGFPGCTLNSLTDSSMKKCSRCKAVSYCGKEHQVMHWKEHKQTCVQI